MKKIISPLLFCVIFSIVFIIAGSCKKEPDWSDIIPKDTTKIIVPETSSWSFKGNNALYSGCIDTAYFSKIDTVILLNLAMSDSLGNIVRITINDASGKFKTGSYTTSAENANIVVLTPTGNYTTFDFSTAFSIEITTINDTLIKGVFAAKLINPINNSQFLISNGTIRALIGKNNICQESNNQDSTAVFTLQSIGSSCGNPTQIGNYIAGTKLDASNTLTLNVNVTSKGLFNITSSKVNGMTFSGKGVFQNTGIQTISLTGIGTPLVNGKDSIPITAGGTNCKFAVTVMTKAGGPNAIYTASPDLCDSAKVFGVYPVFSNLDSSHMVKIKVSVSSPGNYAISTGTLNGIKFSGTGSFNLPGIRIVTLYGSGTPNSTGNNNIPINIRNISCNIRVLVDTAGGPAIPLNTWMFNQGSKVFGGPITISSFGGDIITGKSLLIVGNTLGSIDTTLKLYIQLPDDATNPTPGVYTTDPSSFSDNTSDLTLIKGDLFSLNKIYYSKSAAGTGNYVSMELRILTYDATKKILRGSFSGRAWNKSGNVIEITNGLFRSEVR